MTAGGQMLVLADEALRDRLAGSLDRSSHTVVTDPYDALSELGRRRWPAVVLSSGHADFAGLCRAARRLQADAKLLAVCPASGERDVRALLGKPLDDYYVEPLTPPDLAELRRTAQLGKVGFAGEQAAPSAGTARQLAELVDAAQSVEALESHLAAVVGALMGSPVAWVSTGGVPAGATPLLLAAGTTPRVLVAQAAPRRSPAADAYLTFAQEMLPSLLAVAQRMQGLHLLSITDHLTGAFNRRYFYDATERILARAKAEKFHVTLLLYDIDDFKRYNDTYGHAAGDEILRDTAAMMRKITRDQDIVARIGGDEFAVLFWEPDKPRLPNSRPPETAHSLAHRFRKAVQNHAFRSLGPEARGTLSISGGLASYPRDGENICELLMRADAALKDAKTSGKNAICLVGGNGYAGPM